MDDRDPPSGRPILLVTGRALLPRLLGLGGLLAVAGVFAEPVAVSATLPSKNQCKFANRSSAARLSFGTLQPGSKATASTTLSFSCGGSDALVWFALEQNGGLHRQAGMNRLRHASPPTPAPASEYLHIPYSLVLSPASGSVGKNSDVTVAIEGVIQATDFRSALPGPYADTVVITLLP